MVMNSLFLLDFEQTADVSGSQEGAVLIVHDSLVVAWCVCCRTVNAPFVGQINFWSYCSVPLSVKPVGKYTDIVGGVRLLSQVRLSHVCDSCPITNADFLCQAVESTRGDHTLHPEYSLRPTAASFHPGTYTPISACDAYSYS